MLHNHLVWKRADSGLQTLLLKQGNSTRHEPHIIAGDIKGRTEGNRINDNPLTTLNADKDPVPGVDYCPCGIND